MTIEAAPMKWQCCTCCTVLSAEKSSAFGIAWQKAELQMAGKNPEQDGLTKNHAVAYHVYSFETPNICKSFNAAVHNGKNNYKRLSYQRLTTNVTTQIFLACGDN